MRALIVKTSSLGDIIHAFPVAAYLQDRCPGILIDWVVEQPFSELVRSHPYVHSVYTVHTKKWRKGRGWKEIAAIRKQLKSQSWDVVFDLQGNSKSAILTHWANSSDKVGYGDRLVFEKPNLWVTTHQYDPPPEANVREENLFLVRSYLQDKAPFQSKAVYLNISTEEEELVDQIDRRLPNQRKVMVCPGSAWLSKQVEQKALVCFLKQIPKTHFLLIWGSDSEREAVDFLHREIPNSSVMDRFSIPVLQNLMGRVDEVIAMDSLPLHLAATIDVPTYSVFGASSAQKYKPFGKKHRAFQGVCPYGRTFSRRCPILRTCETGACIRSLTGDELFEHYSSSKI
ncbi:putative lipopolysaccharide heptosyltransferase I [Waddlia chondrophila 2032/99]|uniref:Putative lipopolysaccharide heptosyltransferase I n=2 Tax=Waddlia chondrophila TaxID=71667 RepID=D6YVW9_WADCW|nr:glycosyltransferase family 9 protein [Waddlia chondrophila]ADI38280.1 putative lipopolysaccharide heptosyltransferase I [Waddlia chondrophila WSU 86-1044]CCB91361.1 putative lipopolysaccharide heptosyltransferase I [Waddlia chondrophila 2032/99]